MTWILNHLLWIPWILIIFLIGYALNYVHRGDIWQNERDMKRAKERGLKRLRVLEARYNRIA